MLSIRIWKSDAEKKVLIKAISRLSGREQMIIRMRFGLGTADGEEKTQKEVADMLGISQSYISRLEKNDYAKIAPGNGEVFLKMCYNKRKKGAWSYEA